MSIKFCIDPGHGMGNIKAGKYDPGASGGGLTEADVVLHWALTGKWVASQLGIPVFLTRDDDSDSDPVSLRDDLAKANGCTHFLSLHCNAASPVARGVETFYRDAADKVLAQKVQDSLLKVYGPEVPNRGLKLESQSQHPRLAVLDFGPPAALVELGFISNANDRVLLVSREKRVAFWKELLPKI